MIQAEIKPAEPAIPGSPSKIVSDGTNLYVANGNLWKWEPAATPEASKWHHIQKPGGNVRDVAYIGGHLFALSVGNDSASLSYTTDLVNYSNWTNVPNNSGFEFIQSVYAASDICAVLARKSKSDEYDILVYDNNSRTLTETGFNKKISGIAKFNGKYYIAAADGVYIADFTPAVTIDVIPDTKEKSVWMGITADNDRIVAVSLNGYVYYNDTSSREKVERKDDSNSFTGAVCFWENEGSVYALIGIHGSSYTNGYRELEITTDGALGKYVKPESISVAESEKYSSTIGTHAISSILQPPGNIKAKGEGDNRPLLFASSQQNGLWSYRGVWNAEEK
jgi:hypothetical protein